MVRWWREKSTFQKFEVVFPISVMIAVYLVIRFVGFGSEDTGFVLKMMVFTPYIVTVGLPASVVLLSSEHGWRGIYIPVVLLLATVIYAIIGVIHILVDRLFSAYPDVGSLDWYSQLWYYGLTIFFLLFLATLYYVIPHKAIKFDKYLMKMEITKFEDVIEIHKRSFFVIAHIIAFGTSILFVSAGLTNPFEDAYVFLTLVLIQSMIVIVISPIVTMIVSKTKPILTFIVGGLFIILGILAFIYWGLPTLSS